VVPPQSKECDERKEENPDPESYAKLMNQMEGKYPKT